MLLVTPAVHGETIDRVLWGRDREAKFKDRLATDYRVEVLTPSNEWRLVAGSLDRKPYSAEQAEKNATTFSLEGGSNKNRRQLLKKLEAGGPFKVITFGDSISAGGEASSQALRVRTQALRVGCS